MTDLRAPLKTPAIEIHYTPDQVAALYGVNRKTIYDWFRDRPGVLHIASRDSSRDEIRIPHSVLEAVHRERSGRG